jgi:hypothetical protein
MTCHRRSMLPLRLFAMLMAILVAVQVAEKPYRHAQAPDAAAPRQMTGASFHLRAGSVSLSLTGGHGPAILF